MNGTAMAIFGCYLMWHSGEVVTPAPAVRIGLCLFGFVVTVLGCFIP